MDLPCHSPGCDRPGANMAGYCCHGCARHSKFGQSLLHGELCDEANPDAEEVARSLREEITAALEKSRSLIPSDQAAAVMDVVQGEQKHARADALFWAARQLRSLPITCTALTGPYWYGQGWKEAADHLMDLAEWDPSDGEAERTQLADRARVLEEENRRLRGDLDAATRFEVGGVEVYQARFGGWVLCVDRVRVEKADTREDALLRARAIAEEGA